MNRRKKKIILRMQKRVMKKSILPRKKTVLSTLERVTDFNDSFLPPGNS